MTADEWEKALATWRVCQHELEGGFCSDCAAEIRRVFTAEGRAEAIEAAAKICDAKAEDAKLGAARGLAWAIAVQIRALAPATTKEPT